MKVSATSKKRSRGLIHFFLAVWRPFRALQHTLADSRCRPQVSR